MRILFSADHHIKLGQKNVPREWQINRYNMLWERLHHLESVVDVHIMGGDIFDNIPKPDEMALFFDFISNCQIPTVIYDGNHEATKKGQTFLSFLSNTVSNINELATIYQTEDVLGVLDSVIDIIPYTELKTFNPKDYHNRILCTHVRGSIPPHVKPEIDLAKFKRWDVVLAGDLHSYSNCQENILYPGSPLSISFHRNSITNGVILFDTDTMEHEWVDLELPQLIRKTVTSKKDIIKTDFDHTIYEVEGSLLDLSDIDTDSEIVDKKVVNTTTETTLNLKNLTLQEELSKYLTEVLKLQETEVSSILGTFNDYNKEFEME
jgi:DNA repair exonuclease SbcCD nuclease subunit